MLTIDEVLIGTRPSTPMTNAQRRAHQNLGRAERRLIVLLDTEADDHRIQRQESTVRRLTTAWKKECAR